MTTDAGRPTAIALRDVSKVYRVHAGEGRGRLKSALLPFRRERYFTETSALEPVALDIGAGEVVGVLGRNGSGKSTLLKLIAGRTSPTTGSIHLNGEVRCLLGTGAGFNPAFTGRENIILGSLALGIPRARAIENTPGILDFTELHDQIDQPTRYYSLGMRARLALGVALQDPPEILLLDEALSAGDPHFRAKFGERIADIFGSGRTIVLVSHSTEVIKRLCHRALLLERGRIVEDGSPADVVHEYTSKMFGAAGEAAPAAPEAPVEPPPVEVLEAWMTDEDGVRADVFDHGRPLRLTVRIRANATVPRARLVIDLHSADFGIRLATLGSHYLSATTGTLEHLGALELDGEHEIVVDVPRNELGSGTYEWRVTVREWNAGAGAPAAASGPVARFRSRSFGDAPQSDVRRTVLEPACHVSVAPLAAPSRAHAEPAGERGGAG